MEKRIIDLQEIMQTVINIQKSIIELQGLFYIAYKYASGKFAVLSRKPLNSAYTIRNREVLKIVMI